MKNKESNKVNRAKINRVFSWSLWKMEK